MALRWLLALLLALPGAWGTCPQAPIFVFAELTTTPQESYPVGTQLRYRCRPGYVRNGDQAPVVTCLPNSTWSEQPDFCIGKSCGQPDISNGNFHTSTNLLLGATITFTCNIGYRLVGPPTAQCVFKNGEAYWDNIPICEIIACPPPPEIKNGQLLGGEEFTFGTSVSYSCNTGLSLIGDVTIYCTMGPNYQGTWNAPAPECKMVSCEDPDVKNGKRLSGFGLEHTYKDTVSFECNPGYKMNGSSVVTCEANSSWTPPLPTCEKMGKNPFWKGVNFFSFLRYKVINPSAKCVASGNGVHWDPAPPYCSRANMIVVGIFPLLLAMLIMNI
ncbi:membrane cofactor protein [Manacus vitellinus]|uniref:membrane cofactor protein n=1 Tax=Manacus vitellinus TaxID=328815 RepID=UPI000DF0E13D|nr:membrane cofactor protein [Manacus vitellinus]